MKSQAHIGGDLPRISKFQGLLVILCILFFLVILSQIRLPVLGRTAESTPQVYLPVIQKPLSPASTSTPSPTTTPTLQPTSDWLVYVNWLRSLGGLPALEENPDWSHGDYLHAVYMVKNDYAGHEEDPDNLYYTMEGALAADNSDVMVSSNVNATDNSAIDLWMGGPFHGIGIIDPALSTTGFGSYREEGGIWQMGASLDVLRGLGNIPSSITFPIFWPGNGSVMPFTRFNGGEWPDPLTVCPGYTPPSGPPIYLQIGDGSSVPNVSAHSIQKAGSFLQHCIFDETTYTNPDNYAQSLGRAVLDMRDAIVLIPREPLETGATYIVSITTNGSTYTWSFVVTGIDILSIPAAVIH